MATKEQIAENDRESKQQFTTIRRPKLLRTPNPDKNRTIEPNTTPNWSAKDVAK